MPEIYIPEPEIPDIYSFGYNKQLYRSSPDIKLGSVGSDSNDVITNSTTNGISPSSIISGNLSSSVGGIVKIESLMGEGTDGDAIIASNLTLSADVYYNNLNINSGKVVTTAGYKIFVKNRFENNGTIRRNGNVGANATSGGPGSGGAALTASSLGGSGYGGPGMDDPGVTCGGVGGGENVNPSIGGVGGVGGNSGCIAGTVTAPISGWKAYPYIVQMFDYQATPALIEGGSGGGGGAGPAGGDYFGGGGGAGGGVILIACKTLINNGTIEAKGGNGGTGYGASGGGGGGGGGGAIILVYQTKSLAGTTSVVGGTGGTGSGGNGADGSSGTLYEFKLE